MFSQGLECIRICALRPKTPTNMHTDFSERVYLSIHPSMMYTYQLSKYILVLTYAILRNTHTIQSLFIRSTHEPPLATDHRV